jgi:Ca2+-transporting ATPase
MFYGALITVSTLAAFLLYTDGDVRRAQTIAFMTLAFAQLFHLGNARSDTPVFDVKRALANPYAVGGLTLSIVLQLVAVYADPLPRILGLAPLDQRDWLIVIAFALVPAVVGQGIKLVQRRSASSLPA